MDISLAKLPWHAQVGAFLVLALAGAGVFVWYYEMPFREDMEARQTQLTALRNDISKGQATAKQLSQFRAEVDDLEGRLGSLRAVLPEEKDAADLLRNVNTLAVQSNLTIRGFKPQPITTRQMHAEWPIALDLEGSYHNLGRFLDSVSKFPRIINVGNLSIRSTAQATSTATIEVTCTATTFVLIDAPSASAAAKKGAAPASKTE